METDRLAAHSIKLPNGNNLERVIIPLTKSGNPCYWESGGGTTNTGRATIVTDRLFQKLRPLYIKRKGMLSNGSHAMLPLRRGFHIIDVKHHREDFEITVFQVVSIVKDVAALEVINQFSAETSNSWKGTLIEDAVIAGINKSKDYHCKKAYYVLNNHIDD